MNRTQYDTCIRGGSLKDSEYLALARANDIKHRDIIKQFGSWAVTRYGLESLSFYYAIPKGRLLEDWERHMATKVWVVQPDFTKALKCAREVHKVKGACLT